VKHRGFCQPLWSAGYGRRWVDSHELKLAGEIVDVF
jgi:hypothetical protein